ncbi:hypothetical protein [Streptomyces sp. NPDC058335]|uniref:hypothetical protein n=1 Tax=Streptomyces sp. NPDC058335 TaxID=3346451 RepID=UPI003653553D
MASQQARQFLDRMHENVWEGMDLTPRPPSAADDAEAERIIEDLLRRQAALVSSEELERLREGLYENEQRLRGMTVSKYENARTMQSLHKLADSLERAGRIAGWRVPERPLLGTLPTGRVNVITLLVPGTGEHLVLFESEFSGFTYLAAKAVAEVLPFRRTPDGGAAFELEPAKVRERLERHPESARRFGELVAAYLETGVPYNAPQYMQDRVRNTWAQMLCDSVQLFALGHEYGHILKGHLGRRRPAVWLGGPDLADPEELAWNNQEEIEADAQGLTLSIAAGQSRGHDVPIGFLGADFYFTMTHVIERAINVLRHGHENTSAEAGTHPPSVLRRMILRHVLSRHSTPQIEAAIGLGENMEQAVEMLWHDLRPRLLAAHRAGLRPLGQWQD